jgi:S-adenosylmethionine synthetase
VDTFGTGRVAETDIQAELESGELFDFRPASIIEDLRLTRPDGWSYRDTSVTGHFGRDIFSWEQTDKAQALAEALGIKEKRVA